MSFIEILTIVIALVALIVTVIGFFASLRFYRDGMAMQAAAQKALATIEERASAIQTQVGGMFERTLEAAIGHASPQEAERRQLEALKTSKSDIPSDEAATPPASEGGLFADEESAIRTVKFYAFQRMRISDVLDPSGRAVFNLGSTGGFNLFDGTDGLLFIGYFIDHDGAEVVARTRILFNSMDVAYKRLDEPLVDPATRFQAISLLARISVDLVVREGINKDALLDKIQEYQPEYRSIEVTIRTPSEIEAELESEYKKMEV